MGNFVSGTPLISYIANKFPSMVSEAALLQNGRLMLKINASFRCRIMRARDSLKSVTSGL